MSSGLYIAFVGPSGCGKGTQIALLRENLPQVFPSQKFVFTREPGGTPYAEEIRKLLKNRALAPDEEASFFALARSSTLSQVVRPALSRGEIVISDRCFIDSLAYQGYGRGLGIAKVWDYNKDIVRGCVPDIVIFLDTGMGASIERSRKDNPDKFDSEGEEFWKRIYPGYLDSLEWFHKRFPGSETHRIWDKEGIMSKECVHHFVRKPLDPRIELLQKGEGVIRGEREMKVVQFPKWTGSSN